MAGKKRTAQVPGAPTTEGAAASDGAPEVKAPKLERTADLHPAIKEAVAGADKMSHADAQRLAGEGKLVDRVLTEKGWYIPNAEKVIG